MKNTVLILITVVCLGCAGKSADDNSDTSSSIIYLSSPARSPSSVPFLFTGEKGDVYLSWVEKKDTLHQFKFSRLDEGVWSAPGLISAGSGWVVNWADYPMIAAHGDGNLIAHILTESGGGHHAYDIRMLTSSDHGGTWGQPFMLHDDGKKAEHGFVSVLAHKEKFFVAWLDGRNTGIEEMDHSKMDHSKTDDGHHGAMSLRAAFLDAEGKKLDEWELDNKTCDCCQTTAAITDNGPVVIYRDRSDDEIRDISVVRLIDGSWTTPKPVFADGWKIAGCPVNGPSASAVGNNMSVAWFSAPEGKATVRVVFSKDGGATFGTPIRVDEGKPNGRVDVVQLDDNSCVVSWMEQGTIKAVKVDRDGNKEEPVTIASSSEARSSGFPQMTLGNKQLIFAWTDDKEKIVKVASLPLTF